MITDLCNLLAHQQAAHQRALFDHMHLRSQIAGLERAGRHGHAAQLRQWLPHMTSEEEDKASNLAEASELFSTVVTKVSAANDSH